MGGERDGGRREEGIKGVKKKEIKREEGWREEGWTSHYDCGAQAFLTGMIKTELTHI